MIPGHTCATCAFFCPPSYQQRTVEVRGQCRRHAPTLDLSEGRPRSIWPITNDRQWCGEHATVES